MKTVKAAYITLIIVVLVTGCGTDKLIHASNHGRISANQKVRMKAGSLSGQKYIWVQCKEDGHKKFVYFILFKSPQIKNEGVNFRIHRESYQKGKYLFTSYSRKDSTGEEPVLKEEFQTLLYVSQNLKQYNISNSFNESAIRQVKSWGRKITVN